MNLFSKTFIGIDFHDYSAQLVELKKEGESITLKAFNRKVLKPGVIRAGEIMQVDELKLTLKHLLANANPRPIVEKNIALVFPASKVMSHIYTFPGSLNEKEIAKALPFEIEKTIPYSLNDIYWDFNLLQKDESGNQYVLMSAIIKKTADIYTEVLSSLSITPALFGIQAQALTKSFEKYFKKDETALIIDIGAISTHYIVVKNGTILYVLSDTLGGIRLLPQMAAELSSSELIMLDKKEKNNLSEQKNSHTLNEFFTDIFQKGRRIIEMQEARSGVEKINNIYLSGEFLNLPNLVDHLKKFYPKKHLQIADPNIGLKVESEKFKGKTTPPATFFSSAIGVALCAISQKGYINLLPKSLKESLSNKKSAFTVAAVSFCLTIISVFISLSLTFGYFETSTARANLAAEKQAIENLVNLDRYQDMRVKIEEFNQEVEALTQIDQSIFSMPETLDNLLRLVPVNIKLYSIKYNSLSHVVTLTGLSDDRSDLLTLTSNLENSDLVTSVNSPRSNFDQKNNITFQVTVHLNPNQLK
jgi:type IV pilus assembly protein PilM